ncbi:MAG: hypothetical protein QF441_13355 [Bacteriovoracaceae bacterium]|jgi:hypothetical protein|nr:hypothetical protein [Bacteriovoracaceae bacterium]
MKKLFLGLILISTSSIYAAPVEKADFFESAHWLDSQPVENCIAKIGNTTLDLKLIARKTEKGTKRSILVDGGNNKYERSKEFDCNLESTTFYGMNTKGIGAVSLLPNSSCAFSINLDNGRGKAEVIERRMIQKSATMTSLEKIKTRKYSINCDTK